MTTPVRTTAAAAPIDASSSSESPDVKLARSIANADVIENGPFTPPSFLGHGTGAAAEVRTLTDAAKRAGATNPEDIGRMAFAFKHGLSSMLDPELHNPMEHALDALATDGDISKEDERLIAAAAPTLLRDALYSPSSADASSTWQQSFSPASLSALAIDQARAAALRAADIKRTSEALHTTIGARNAPFYLDRAQSEIISASADAVRHAQLQEYAKSGADVAMELVRANPVAKLLQSSEATERTRGNLMLRSLLDANRPSIDFERHVGTERRAKIANSVISQLSDDQLRSIEPRTAAFMLMALHKTYEYEARDSADNNVDVSRGVEPSPSDTLAFKMLALSRVDPEYAAADNRLTAAQRAISTVEREGILSEVRLEPRYE